MNADFHAPSRTAAEVADCFLFEIRAAKRVELFEFFAEPPCCFAHRRYIVQCRCHILLAGVS
jgi:hypothetical protein